ncbi:integrase core domain-containing protein [Amaricoccus sp.]|uniref:integrase core domain-containing protein n=1 Tax=Amaricoccus sp. TaxID=1872485 RepID=UPI0039E528D6
MREHRHVAAREGRLLLRDRVQGHRWIGNDPVAIVAGDLPVHLGAIRRLEARTTIERWRLDYNLVRPHSAHGGLTPDAVRQDPAAGRLRHTNRSAGRPLPSATEVHYQNQGLSQ